MMENPQHVGLRERWSYCNKYTHFQNRHDGSHAPILYFASTCVLLLKQVIESRVKSQESIIGSNQYIKTLGLVLHHACIHNHAYMHPLGTFYPTKGLSQSSDYIPYLPTLLIKGSLATPNK